MPAPAELLSYIHARTDAEAITILFHSRRPHLPAFQMSELHEDAGRGRHHTHVELGTRVCWRSHTGSPSCILEAYGPGRDLHSGVFGLTVHEPLASLMASWPPRKERVYEKLESPTSASDVESAIAFKAKRVRSRPAVPISSRVYAAHLYTVEPPPYPRTSHSIVLFPPPLANASSQIQVLVRLPSLSLHGIERAFAGRVREDGHPGEGGGKPWYSVHLCVYRL
ncbi:hypothetical protein B0H17DRAFT_1337842 [Mycena rosella]|uniref:Uncharacterized protein n=1 Tax=Mycena rosella TaxID=1033263 RepID=A0AAD7CQ38_MYCRO|nr:hypothetical protein B0H17DRAFT_1337842 [Mycena rosella]